MASSSNASNEAQIYGYLISQGFPASDAAGALGNLQVESGFSPTAYNAGEGAIGIAQWEGGRRTALQNYAAAHGGKETDLAMQLGYLGQELKHGYSSVLRTFTTGPVEAPAAAAAIWDADFEASAGTTRTQRVNNAQTIYQQITTGALTPTSTTVPGSAGFAASKVKPPFPLYSLHTPLTAAQRTKMIAYLKRAPHDASIVPSTNYSTMSDGELLIAYNNTVSSNSGTASPGQIVGDLASGAFGWVVSLAIKVTFTLAGLGVVLVGANAATHGGR